MFEGWVADVFATYLGKFIDVQRDRLRISLWAGQCVLENVRLRTEAFDYLKLPVAIGAGSVGRLTLKIPWGRWTMTGQPLVIELTDVTLYLTSRQDHEWEEGPALQRDHAAKQADLAAAELAKLSSRMAQQKGPAEAAEAATGSSGSSGGIWGLRYLMELLTSFLLNRLQLSISNLHVFFKAPGQEDSACGVLGLQVGSVSTTADIRSLPASLAEVFNGSAQRLVGARIVRHLSVRQWHLYWQCQGEPGPRQAVPHSSDYILRPVDCAVRLALGAPSPQQQQQQHHHAGEAHSQSCPLQVLVGTQLLHLQINPQQLLGMLKLLDDFEVWTRRNRYGRFRPPGWRTALERPAADASIHAGGESLKLQPTSGAPGTLLPRSSAATATAVGQQHTSAFQRHGGSMGNMATWPSSGTTMAGDSRSACGRTGSIGGGRSGSFGARGSGAGAYSAYESPCPGLEVPGSSGLVSCSSLPADLDKEQQQQQQPSQQPRRQLHQEQQRQWRATASPSSSLARAPGSTTGMASLGSMGSLDSEAVSALSTVAAAAAAAAAAAGARAEDADPGATRVEVPGVAWSQVWQYAVRSVLYDLRMRRRSTNAPRHMREFCALRKRYIVLYKRRLESLRTAHPGGSGGSRRVSGTRHGSPNRGAEASPMYRRASQDRLVETDMDDVTAVELHRLEADLGVQQIMLFRALAEQELEQQDQEGARQLLRQQAPGLTQAPSRTPSMASHQETASDGQLCPPSSPALSFPLSRSRSASPLPERGRSFQPSSPQAPATPTHYRRASGSFSLPETAVGGSPSESPVHMSSDEAGITEEGSEAAAPAMPSTASTATAMPAPARNPQPPHHSWLAWGIHGMFGYLSGSSQAGSCGPRPPTAADVHELYNLLQGPEPLAVSAAASPCLDDSPPTVRETEPSASQSDAVARTDVESGSNPSTHCLELEVAPEACPPSPPALETTPTAGGISACVDGVSADQNTASTVPAPMPLATAAIPLAGDATAGMPTAPSPAPAVPKVPPFATPTSEPQPPPASPAPSPSELGPHPPSQQQQQQQPSKHQEQPAQNDGVLVKFGIHVLEAVLSIKGWPPSPAPQAPRHHDTQQTATTAAPAPPPLSLPSVPPPSPAGYASPRADTQQPQPARLQGISYAAVLKRSVAAAATRASPPNRELGVTSPESATVEIPQELMRLRLKGASVQAAVTMSGSAQVQLELADITAFDCCTEPGAQLVMLSRAHADGQQQRQPHVSPSLAVQPHVSPTASVAVPTPSRTTAMRSPWASLLELTSLDREGHAHAESDLSWHAGPPSGGAPTGTAAAAATAAAGGTGPEPQLPLLSLHLLLPVTSPSSPEGTTTSNTLPGQSLTAHVAPLRMVVHPACLSELSLAFEDMTLHGSLNQELVCSLSRLPSRRAQQLASCQHLGFVTWSCNVKVEVEELVVVLEEPSKAGILTTSSEPVVQASNDKADEQGVGSRVELIMRSVCLSAQPNVLQSTALRTLRRLHESCSCAPLWCVTMCDAEAALSGLARPCSTGSSPPSSDAVDGCGALDRALEEAESCVVYHQLKLALPSLDVVHHKASTRPLPDHSHVPAVQPVQAADAPTRYSRAHSPSLIPSSNTKHSPLEGKPATQPQALLHSQLHGHGSSVHPLPRLSLEVDLSMNQLAPFDSSRAHNRAKVNMSGFSGVLRASQLAELQTTATAALSGWGTTATRDAAAGAMQQPSQGSINPTASSDMEHTTSSKLTMPLIVNSGHVPAPTRQRQVLPGAPLPEATTATEQPAAPPAATATDQGHSHHPLKARDASQPVPQSLACDVAVAPFSLTYVHDLPGDSNSSTQQNAPAGKGTAGSAAGPAGNAAGKAAGNAAGPAGKATGFGGPAGNTAGPTGKAAGNTVGPAGNVAGKAAGLAGPAGIAAGSALVSAELSVLTLSCAGLSAAVNAKGTSVQVQVCAKQLELCNLNGTGPPPGLLPFPFQRIFIHKANVCFESVDGNTPSMASHSSSGSTDGGHGYNGSKSSSSSTSSSSRGAGNVQLHTDDAADASASQAQHLSGWEVAARLYGAELRGHPEDPGNFILPNRTDPEDIRPMLAMSYRSWMVPGSCSSSPQQQQQQASDCSSGAQQQEQQQQASGYSSGAQQPQQQPQASDCSSGAQQQQQQQAVGCSSGAELQLELCNLGLGLGTVLALFPSAGGDASSAPQQQQQEQQQEEQEPPGFGLRIHLHDCLCLAMCNSAGGAASSGMGTGGLESTSARVQGAPMMPSCPALLGLHDLLLALPDPRLPLSASSFHGSSLLQGELLSFMARPWPSVHRTSRKRGTSCDSSLPGLSAAEDSAAPAPALVADPGGVSTVLELKDLLLCLADAPGSGQLAPVLHVSHARMVQAAGCKELVCGQQRRRGQQQGQPVQEHGQQQQPGQQEQQQQQQPVDVPHTFRPSSSESSRCHSQLNADVFELAIDTVHVALQPQQASVLLHDVMPIFDTLAPKQQQQQQQESPPSTPARKKQRHKKELAHSHSHAHERTEPDTVEANGRDSCSSSSSSSAGSINTKAGSLLQYLPSMHMSVHIGALIARLSCLSPQEAQPGFFQTVNHAETSLVELRVLNTALHYCYSDNDDNTYPVEATMPDDGQLGTTGREAAVCSLTLQSLIVVHATVMPRLNEQRQQACAPLEAAAATAHTARQQLGQDPGSPIGGVPGLPYGFLDGISPCCSRTLDPLLLQVMQLLLSGRSDEWVAPAQRARAPSMLAAGRPSFSAAANAEPSAGAHSASLEEAGRQLSLASYITASSFLAGSNAPSFTPAARQRPAILAAWSF